MKKKQLIVFGKTGLSSATHDLYALLTNFSRMITLNKQQHFILSFLFLFFFSLSLFKLSCTKKYHVYHLYRISYTLSFCNAIYYIVPEIYIGGRFLDDCLNCYYQEFISKSLCDKNLLPRVYVTATGFELTMTQLVNAHSII